ncbi:MAG: MoaD/ThiS family protein [Fimbriiglobus sp.]
MIAVQLFGALREQHGPTVQASANTVGELRTALASLSPLVARCRVAVNQEFADDDVVLNPTDEVALIPPVSGG